MSNQSKIVLGLLGAVAAGAILGLLLAPEKGTELRQRIKDTTGNWVDQLGEAFNTGKEEFNNLKNKVMSKGEGYMSEAEDQFNRANNSMG